MIGLKVRGNNLDLIDKYSGLYDFTEVYIDPDFDFSKLDKYTGKNITIHAAHIEHGFDPSVPELHDRCKELLDLAIKAADIIKSPWIIVHPGRKYSENSEQVMLDFFRKNWDERIIFENCLAIEDFENKIGYLFSLPAEMKKIVRDFNAGFVLDFSHATCTANCLGMDADVLIRDFLDLAPRCFHVSGIRYDSKRDTHLNLFEVENPMKYLFEADHEKYFTFEVKASDLLDRSIQQKNIEFFYEKIGNKKSILVTTGN